MPTALVATTAVGTTTSIASIIATGVALRGTATIAMATGETAIGRTIDADAATAIAINSAWSDLATTGESKLVVVATTAAAIAICRIATANGSANVPKRPANFS